LKNYFPNTYHIKSLYQFTKSLISCVFFHSSFTFFKIKIHQSQQVIQILSSILTTSQIWNLLFSEIPASAGMTEGGGMTEGEIKSHSSKISV
jgi:hypothetical protein